MGLNMVYVVVPLLICVSLTAAQTLVNIPGLGSLQGTTSQSYFTKRTIYEFKGIPFAERPVRFMPPEKKTPWNGVLNATSFGRACPQISMVNTTPEGDLEDCLFLNVYSPKVNNASKLPVLFYIHGGGFSAGSSQDVAPGFFLEHDIVIVAPQYRLGPLGFLSLGTQSVGGNAAMYDQLMALQWTYDNIEHFGGNPDMITVAGVSAGAASAAVQYVSPLTQDLIKQVLLFSGTAVAFWAVGTEPVTDSLLIAKYAGCDPAGDVQACLKSLDPLTIVKAYDQYQSAERTQARSGMGGSNPMVDGLFLTEMPLETMSKPDFKGRPMIMSVVKHEGQFLEDVLYQYYLKGNNLTDSFTELKYNIPDVLLSYTDMKDLAYTIGTAIKDEYFKPQEFGNYTAMKAGITDFLGSAYFKGPARKMAELNNMRGGTTYLSTFNYNSPGFGMDGVIAHGRDQAMIFPFEWFSYTEEDLLVIRNMTAMYAQFISTGTPSGVSWKPYSLESDEYLIIDTTMTMNSPFEQQYTIAEQEGLYK
ncbi:acetylcholinesterase isoform X2 [Anabrus simplex]|uniref:acetylcholinesterase isoform X2 n=1 Tax=Anabrus simplex TaxID=316456 RepID=UPI0035A30E5A